MTDSLSYLLAMSCTLPAMAGLRQLKKTGRTYLPFVCMMLATMITETIVYLAKKEIVQWGHAFFYINLYMVANFYLFLRFTEQNGFLSSRAARLLLYISLALAAGNAVWIGTGYGILFYLLCAVSLVMLFISVDILSRQMMAVHGLLRQNFWFWFAGISVLYNAYTLLIFSLYVLALDGTPYGKAAANIQHYVNAACYVLFAAAVFKIPAKYENNIPGKR